MVGKPAIFYICDGKYMLMYNNHLSAIDSFLNFAG